MNNLKRVLSLALASVMLVGMMAIGAGAADFTDADTIVHQDAVDILVALGVVNGKDDGSFDPKGNVTRAEMAKMIAVAMKGGNDVSTGVKGTATFTDIKGHWAESYIEYCYDLGIISGRGDGTFDPGANVTGLEAAKMVLTALGYDSEAYKLTGAQWATRTDELARIAKPALYETLGSDVVLSDPASRDTAAQMIWNGLQNATMKYEPSTNTSNGEVTWRYTPSDTMLKLRYNADIYTGTFDANSNINTSLEKGHINVTRGTSRPAGTIINTAADSRTNASFPADMDVDFIGEEVQVIYKNGARSTQGGPDKNDTIYGVFVTGTTDVIRTTRDKLEGVKNTKDTIKVDGVEYEIKGGFKVYGNHVEDTTTERLSTTNTNDDPSSFASTVAYASGDAVKVILDDTGKIDTFYFTNSKLAMVTGLSSTKVTLNNGVGTLTIADNDVYDNIAKDDVVVVTTLYDGSATGDDAFNIVKKAEVVDGEMTAYKINDLDGDDEDVLNVTVDGTTYKIKHDSSTAIEHDELADIGLGSKKITALDDTVLNVDVELYLVDGFVGAMKQTSEDATNYSVVLEIRRGTEASSVFTSFQLYVMDGEGTKSVIDVNKKVKVRGDEDITLDSTPEGQFHVGDIITYSLDKDKKANVTIEARPAASSNGYNKDTKSVDGVVTATNAVLFVLTDDGTENSTTYDPDKTGTTGDGQTGARMTIKAYKAADLGNVAPGAGVAKVVSNGKVVAAFLATDATPGGARSNEVYGIVTGMTGTSKVDGTAYTNYTVSVDGESRTVKVKDGTLTKGQVVKFEPTTDDLYDDASDFHFDAAKTFSAYVNEYDADRAIISFYAGDGQVIGDENNFVDGAYTRYVIADDVDPTTYAVSKDVKIYAVDVNDATSAIASASSVTGFNTNTGKRNVILVTSGGTDPEGSDPYVVEVIIVEISGQKDIDDKTPGDLDVIAP